MATREEMEDRLVRAALELARFMGNAGEFSLPVPKSDPPRWVSLHQGPVELAPGDAKRGMTAGGLPGAREYGKLADDLARKIWDACELGDAQQLVLDFIAEVRKLGGRPGG